MNHSSDLHIYHCNGVLTWLQRRFAFFLLLLQSSVRILLFVVKHTSSEHRRSHQASIKTIRRNNAGKQKSERLEELGASAISFPHPTVPNICSIRGVSKCGSFMYKQ
jgi:hypothetical protein